MPAPASYCNSDGGNTVKRWHKLHQSRNIHRVRENEVSKVALGCSKHTALHRNMSKVQLSKKHFAINFNIQNFYISHVSVSVWKSEKAL